MRTKLVLFLVALVIALLLAFFVLTGSSDAPAEAPNAPAAHLYPVDELT